MAGYRPTNRHSKAAVPGAGHPNRITAEDEVARAAKAHAYANEVIQKGGSPRLAARANKLAEQHVRNAQRLARKTSRRATATKAARGLANTGKGIGNAGLRAVGSYSETIKEEGASADDAQKAALSFLTNDAAVGAGNIAKGALGTVHESASKRLRIRRNARKALANEKGMTESGLARADIAKDRTRRSLKVAQRRAVAQKRSALRNIGVNTGESRLKQAGRSLGAVLAAPFNAVRGVTVKQRTLWGLAAVGGGSVALVIVLPLIVAILAGTIATAVSAQKTSPSSNAKIGAYVTQAEAYAADDSIGYSQARRYHNPDMDCSSFVWYSLVDSGTFSSDTLGGSPFTTYTMGQYLKDAGFQEIAFSDIDQSDANGDGAPDGLEYGDIIVNTSNHTEIYIGSGKDVAAHGDHDGKPGDGDGREVDIEGYWNDNWDYVYRLPSSSDVSQDAQGMWSWLKGQGYSDAAAAAIMGNAQQESGIDPTRLQNGSGPAAGLFQWEAYGVNGSRWGRLAAYAKSQGVDWTDMGCQLSFMQQEFAQQLGSSGLETFKNGTDVDALTSQFETTFERGSVPMMEQRIGFARQFLNEFGGTQ